MDLNIILDTNVVLYFLADVTIVDLSKHIKQTTVSLRRQYRLKLLDAIIVATAHFLNAELLTNDIKLLNIPEISISALYLK